jgi:hypothetical protein
MRTEVWEVTVGVDTHSEVHAASDVNNIGKVLGTASFPVTTALTGYKPKKPLDIK